MGAADGCMRRTPPSLGSPVGAALFPAGACWDRVKSMAVPLSVISSLCRKSGFAEHHEYSAPIVRSAKFLYRRSAGLDQSQISAGLTRVRFFHQLHQFIAASSV